MLLRLVPQVVLGCLMGALASGCGSSDVSSNPSSDAGAVDATSDAEADAAADAAADVAADVDPDVAADVGLDGTGQDVAVEADGDVPDAEVETASVTVYDDGTPVSDVDVVFHDALGAPVLHTTTDGDGRATGPVVSGAMVTVLSEAPVTILQVAPGDELVIGHAIPLRAVVGTAELTLPEALSTAEQYIVETGISTQVVSDSSVPVVANIRAGSVLASGQLSVLVHARDADSVPFAYSGVEDVTPALGGTVQVPLPAWKTQFSTLLIRLTESPAGATMLLTRAAPVSNGVAFYRLNDWQATPPAMQANLFLFGIPTQFGTAVEYVVEADYGASGSGIGSVLVKRTTTASTQVEVLLGSALLPAVGTVALDTTEPIQPSVSWSPEAAHDAADGVMVEVAWATPGGESKSWTILGPIGESDVRLPTLPSALSAYAPSNGATFGEAAVTVVDASFVDGYAALKEQYGPLLLEAPFPSDDDDVRFAIGKSQ